MADGVVRGLTGWTLGGDAVLLTRTLVQRQLIPSGPRHHNLFAVRLSSAAKVTFPTSVKIARTGRSDCDSMKSRPGFLTAALAIDPSEQNNKRQKVQTHRPIHMDEKKAFGTRRLPQA